MTLLAALWLALAGAQEPTDAPIPDSLEAAYQKEVAYLLAERDSLRRQLDAQLVEAERAKARGRAGVEGLHARLEALQVRVETAEDDLGAADREALSATEAEDALDATVFQALQAVDGGRVDAGASTEVRAARLREAFAEALRRLDAGAGVTAVDGAWFGADGTEARGRVVALGEIGTWGVRDGAAHALLPAGEGRLQARLGPPRDDVVAWLDGGAPGQVGVFLHEGRSRRVEERPPKTWDDLIEAGGLVGEVILGLGLVALVLAALRVLILAGAARDAELGAAVLDRLRRGAPDEALALARAGRGSVARVLADVLGAGAPEAQLSDVAGEAVSREASRLARFGSAILVIAAVAPLLGLLGTVTGMIATFDVITEFGTGDPRMLSGGISAALVTTQLGLVVAIPALLVGNLLSGWADGLADRAEGVAMRAVLACLAGDDARGFDEPMARASK